MAKLFLMSGIPGSGKSTWLRKHIWHPASAVSSRDGIRFRLVKEDEEYFSKEKEVFKEFIDDINLKLKMGYDVYADATHLNKSSRNKLLSNITEAVDEVSCIFFDIPFETAWERNSGRQGREVVPKSVMRRMFYSIEKPTFEEGFDSIYIIHENETIEKEVRE